ncbi:hypothetical protein G9A89_004399 [Geosiphon pyriformis]|nr:hypothetical protein G9A89_004399 [Geosiphon pyriformis]
MENKEIKRITRLESHDCNECEKCQETIKNNSNNWCSPCWFIFFEKLYQDFSSGNKVVDEIIKNPIYIPPNKNNQNCGDVLYYEWIPWERLSNVNEIARGGFGKIYKATWIDGWIYPWSIRCNGEYKRLEMKVAIKFINTNSSEVFKELNIQRAMFINMGTGLDYICSIYGITQNAETLEYGIVMDFANLGDMRKYLSTNFHSISWCDKLFIASKIAKGLSQIHSSGMVHHDLHPGNILQLNEVEMNIGDLGLCQPVNHEATTTTTDPTTGKDMKEKKIYGVIPYIPPEVLRGEKFTKAGDIYSYGMLLLELVTGKPPFHDFSHDNILIMAILNGKRPKITSPLIPCSIDKLIEKCWDADPKNRPTAEEVIKTFDYIFSELEKYFNEMVESDDSATANQSTTTTNQSTTRTSTRIHPGAVYTSRVLTLQMIQETKELVFLLKDDT